MDEQFCIQKHQKFDGTMAEPREFVFHITRGVVYKHTAQSKAYKEKHFEEKSCVKGSIPKSGMLPLAGKY